MHTATPYTDLHPSGELTTAQPLTKHTQLHHTLIFTPVGNSLQPNPWQNTHSYTIHWSSSQQGTQYSVTPDKTHTATPSSSQRGTHHSAVPNKTHTATPYTDLHPSGELTTAQPLTKHTQLHYTLIFIPAGYPVQRNTQQTHTATPYTDLHPSGALTTVQSPTKHTATPYTDLHPSGALTTVQSPTKHTQLHHTLIFIPAGYPVQRNTQQTHTATPYTDLHPSGALTTVQSPTKHTATPYIDLHLSRALTTAQPPAKHTQLYHTLIFIKAGPSLQCNPWQNARSYTIFYLLIVHIYAPWPAIIQDTHPCASIHPPTHECIPTHTHSYINTPPNPHTNACTHIHPPTLRVSLSHTFLQTLPDLVTPLKGDSLSLVSTLQKVWVLIRLWKQPSTQTRT